ncbi:hypothetical protein RclHR1_00240051 [Rhizophagus clarus]|uniref:DUF659 domain-containing protein n=1 Tax=Rhizophagus clarus TaxID=94130 RepID=A0A2Z6QWN0_9GLOM|nr:hypothetical protein RclHR1_00240051 [Rhizophagus clarus]
MVAIQPCYKLPSRHTLKEMQFEHFVLNVLYIFSPHDAAAIKNAILNITKEFQIENQLIGITSDNEAKIIVATRQIRENITTRWNYTFYMIERALKIKPQLAYLVSNHQTLKNNWPTEKEWKILNNLLELLTSFALMIKVISASNYPTIGEVK